MDLFNELENQKIFTTTLKSEELNKYENISYINNIDYTSHKPSKMLSKDFNIKFKKLLADLSIKLD
ncbi:hypothetical protein [Clostridium cochlearium]|uniref:hypothetical protein n=1 Tax=Clostridium cochlearium TaxID=1494 RepID=UPI0018D546A3|nr:hypothetical protein [Clostridium cochlearium]